MNKFRLILTILLFSLCSFAQKDAKAKEILDKASKAYEQAGDMSVYFNIHIKDPDAGIAHDFDGQLRLKGVKLQLSTPDTETWFDGETQWVYMKSSQEVNISEPSEKEIQSLNPSIIFNIYKTECNYNFNSEKTDNKNRVVYEIELLPQGKSEMTRVIVQINKTDYMPVYFQIFYKNKMENKIHINKYLTKLNHPDTLFSFDESKYPDVEIIDLR
ncbi:MAG: hypothetical protein LBJ72_12190 [Dysgonamonadaceae bacterium]|jgi:outer membrane lipoprotein-sorting protein|nr:hypothetical protein [Dysgonamonadaceae bacterium]